MTFGMNEWTVSGEVFYLKELEGEFAASVKLRGTSTRENSQSSQILEFSCLMQRDVFEKAKRSGLEMYRNVTLSGHVESWQKGVGDKATKKVMFIADYCLEVK